MSTLPLRPPLERDTVRAQTCRPWPLPGAGDTWSRWSRLADVSADDLPLAKLVEPHHDAVAILADLGARPPGPDEVWAVWAAEPPFAVLEARDDGSRWTLSGTKAFCSGASVATHALVTAQTNDGSSLFAVDLSELGIEVSPDGPSWVGQGMSRAETVTLSFSDVAAHPVGAAGAYVDRTGFWLGAIGIAACWLGGARGVAAPLEGASTRLDPHGLAHLGHVRSLLGTTELALRAAADRADQDDLSTYDAQWLAITLRSHVAGVVESVVNHVGRALGPGPLAFDGPHAERVADLLVFVRQHHGERDLEALGSMGRTDA